MIATEIQPRFTIAKSITLGIVIPMLLTTLSYRTQAQNSNNYAQVIDQIEKAYNQEQFDDAISLIEQAEDLNEGSNAEIQYWKIKVLVADEQYEKADQAIDQFNEMDAPSAYRDAVANYEDKVKQHLSSKEETEESGQVYVIVEHMPELIGGRSSLQAKVDYPEKARRAGVEGRVYVQFVVDEQGDVINPRVIRGIGGGCDEEAIEVIKESKFNPGHQGGKKVKVKMSLPVVFKLD